MQFITDNFSNVKKDLLRSLIAIKYSNNIDKITDAYRTMIFFQDDITIESSIMGVPSYRCFLRYVALLLGAYSSMLSTTPLMSALSPTTAIS